MLVSDVSMAQWKYIGGIEELYEYANSVKIYKAYNKYARSGSVIYLDIVNDSGDIINTYKLSRFGELYSYASEVKMYKMYKMYKIAKQFKISIEEKNRIVNLVNRVKKGYTNWVPEDLQLYQNNVEIVEKLLRGENIDWNMYVEDELERELRELKGML
jgi:hypothetical protein